MANENDVTTAKLKSIDGVTVSASVLGDLLGVTDRRVRQLADEGIFLKVSNGRYILADSIKSYITMLKVQNDINNSEDGDGIDLEKEKAIHERIKRQQSELKLALMKGEMHKSDNVKKVMIDMLTSFRTRILNLPSKVAPMLVARNEAGFIKDMLMKEVVEVLNELKDYDPKEFYGDEYIDFEENEVVTNENN